MSNPPDQLPQGYEYASAITAEEVVTLRTESGWGTEKSTDLWQRVIDESIASVGVRDEADTLVGVGFLAGNPRHAVLCDFIVSPDHQGRGLGRAILYKRVNLADELEIPYLYTELAPTNRLKRHYETLGFIANGHVYSRAARRHPAEVAAMQSTT
jgi:GNAT superfamily N-acetyltransferase